MEVYLDEPAFETFVVNGSDVSFASTGLNDRSSICSFIVVTYPALVFLIPISICRVIEMITNQPEYSINE